MALNDLQEPALKQAGTGLPKLEGFLLRHILIPLKLNSTSWQASKALLAKETDLTLSLYNHHIPGELYGEKVLIKRLRGLEEASCYWSPNMVLQHMALVARGMTNVIATLSREQYLIFDVQIGAFKPKEGTQESYAATFEKIMTECDEVLNNITHTRTKARHLHPWFGMLNAHEWYGLLAVHQQIHRKQLEEIIKIISQNR